MEAATDIYGGSCTLICHDSHKFSCQTELRFLELIKTFLSLGVENVRTFNAEKPKYIENHNFQQKACPYFRLQ